MERADFEAQQEHALAFAHEASLGLPGSIKQVADFLLAEGTGIERLTMAEVAARSYTSKSTLVRFAHQAGYDGWTDYRRDFLLAAQRVERERAERVQVDVNYPFGDGASTREMLESLVRTNQLALAELRDHLDRAVLEDAARAIIAARHVAIFGAMQNYQRGRIFASNLGLIGVLCHVPTAGDAAAVARVCGEGDCVVAVSYSGGLRHMPLAFIPELKRRGATVVAVTNSERGELGALADCVLSFSPTEHYHQKVAAFYSGACTSLLLDALYASCYLRRFEESRSNKAAILEGLNGLIPGDFA